MRALRILRRTVLALLATAVLMITGVSYWEAHGLLGGITVSRALGFDAPRSSGGETNILLIGLDSRRDQDGNDLPNYILDKLHAGDSSSGGYNTNTLILVHIGADNRVVAFSIPRDDYVAVSGITGYDHIKIKEAYGLTKAQTEDELREQGITDAGELERQGREAGREATLRAVRNLTGQPIDYFAEVNLAGFYDLAESLGGVEVCLNHAVYDEYSGADFPAGRQRLDAAQALAFVRQRHGLENGDLDRTHRQQAFLLSIMHELQDSGALGNLDEFRALMAVARKDIVLSQGWGEEQFRRLASLAGGDVEFRTLPVVRYENINDQDVNIVDPAAIRAEISAAIDGSPVSTSSVATSEPNPDTVVAVVNASDTYGLAAQAADALVRKGYTVEEIRDRKDGEDLATVVDYGPGADADAAALADILDIPSPPKANPNLPAGKIRVILSPGYEVPGTETTSASTDPTATGSGEPGTSPTPAPDAGTPIDGGAGGVPCVN
jgi:LCP family protein required for cell wall assembly